MRNTRSPNLLLLMDESETDIECRTYLGDLRWPGGVACPRCAATGISRLKARRAFDCNRCRYQFSVTSGTLFHDSHLPLAKWFIGIFVLCESKKRIGTRQLTQALDVSYKTAWLLSDLIRAAMVEVRAAESTPSYFFRDVLLRLLDSKASSQLARRMLSRQGEVG